MSIFLKKYLFLAGFRIASILYYLRKKNVIMEDNKKQEKENVDLENAAKTDEKEKKEGSGIFTVDGKELPKIEGGYTAYNPGGSLGDNDFKS